MPEKKAIYDESQIKHLDALEHIRLRSGMYIGRLGNGSNQNDGIYILLKEAIDKKLIKDLPIPLIKLIIEGAIEKFLTSKELSNTKYSYEESLNGMIDIIMNGLKVRD